MATEINPEEIADGDGTIAMAMQLWSARHEAVDLQQVAVGVFRIEADGLGRCCAS